MLETIIIYGCVQLGGIAFTSILSSFRSKSNGWQSDGEAGFEPDFTYRCGSSYRRKLRYVTTKSKCKASESEKTNTIVAEDDQSNAIERGVSDASSKLSQLKNFFFTNSNSGTPCKVLILFSDTGGGHRASAQAMVAAFNLAYPGKFDCELLDIWRHHSVPPLNSLVETYQFAAKNPWVWQLMYIKAEFPITRWIFQELGNMTSHGKFRRVFEEKKPDLIISVHPLCQNLPLRVLKKMGNGKRDVPFVTVVTDLGGAHPTWFDPETDQIYIPSDPIRRMAFRERAHPDQILQLGLPIRPDFWKDAGVKGAMQNKLGMKKDVKSVLVVGGGDGVGGLKNVALRVIDRLSQEQEDRQVVVVCGSNRELKEELENMAFPATVNVIVNGYVKNMDEWMAACDVLITKAGPGTIAEAAIRGLPVMLSNYLPGQEEGNLDFVKEHGFGEYSSKPEVIADTVASWLNDPVKLDLMSKKAREAGRPSATNDIVQGIGKFMGISS